MTNPDAPRLNKHQRRALKAARRGRAMRQPMSAAAIDRWEAREAAAREADRAEEAHTEAVRATLLDAGRVARSLGFAVRSSTMHGRVSSYYAERDGVTLRISDHDIPETPERVHAAGGYYDGYRGRWLRIDQPRTAHWLRRAIVLAAAGRTVPGTGR